MSPGKKTDWRKTLWNLCEGASKVLLKYYQKKLRIEVKTDAGLVTQADKEAEALILRKIRKQFPSSSFLAEESGEETHPGSDLLWIIDPLDGTSNYAHGFPFFCTSIAVHQHGAPLAGAIYHPLLREFFFAQKGKGAFLGKRRLRVSTTDRLERALLGTGFYYAKGDPLREEVEFFRRANEAVLGVRRPGAAALDLAYVACGRYDGFWERGLAPWDVAAGFLLIEEAGGKISDYAGNPTHIHRREALASNSQLHAALVQLLLPPRRS